MADNKYIDFDEYFRQGEPSKRESAFIWSTAIGLQAVDGLKTSQYLQETARRNIEGEITLAQAKELIWSYYEQKSTREQVNDDDQEADKVSANIAEILSTTSLAFNTNGFISLHRRIFNGVFKHAGKIRTYDISKKEWILKGDSVSYLNWQDLRRALDFDIEGEQKFDFVNLTMDEMILHITNFVSGIWQIHPFCEGNTRTTAVFTIQYLRSIGFEVDNEMFANHSWYFRNALVRANYGNYLKGIQRTTVFLERFFRNLLLNEKWVLKNRFLIIDPPDEYKIQPRLDSTQEIQVSTQEINSGPQRGTQEKPKSTQEMILEELAVHPFTTRDELAKLVGISPDGIKKQLDKLKRAGTIRHVGATKKGHWEIIRK
ncbi:MAG: Fic family protein [Bacteroidales bacterium]|nr:Fic family protein [Bacteroidales bacterium]